MEIQVGALITAAGSGSRFGEPKQFLELSTGERVVDRAVATAKAVATWTAIVLPEGSAWDGEAVDVSTTGGRSRYESIAIGLALVPEEIDVLLVHSASHPLASIELARRLITAIADGADGAVPFLPATDVIKERDSSGSLRTIGREGLGSAQCPMAFSRPMLDRAFAEIDDGTEESQLVEAIGGRVVAVEGEVSNLHIVDRSGLAVARALSLLETQLEISSESSPAV